MSGSRSKLVVVVVVALLALCHHHQRTAAAPACVPLERLRGDQWQARAAQAHEAVRSGWFDPDAWMMQAIAVAKSGTAPFGALIVDPVCNTLIVEGANNSTHNPMLHGEVMAIQNLSSRFPDAPGGSLGAALVLLTTAEPCTMCIGAIEWAGFQAVYFGSSVKYLIDHGYSQMNITAAEVASVALFPGRQYNTQVIGGVLEHACNQLYDNGPE